MGKLCQACHLGYGCGRMHHGALCKALVSVAGMGERCSGC